MSQIAIRSDAVREHVFKKPLPVLLPIARIVRPLVTLNRIDAPAIFNKPNNGVTNLAKTKPNSAVTVLLNRILPSKLNNDVAVSANTKQNDGVPSESNIVVAAPTNAKAVRAKSAVKHEKYVKLAQIPGRSDCDQVVPRRAAVRNRKQPIRLNYSGERCCSCKQNVFHFAIPEGCSGRDIVCSFECMRKSQKE